MYTHTQAYIQTCMHTAFSTGWSWKPDWGNKGMKKGQKSWDEELFLMEWCLLLHSSPRTQSFLWTVLTKGWAGEQSVGLYREQSQVGVIPEVGGGTHTVNTDEKVALPVPMGLRHCSPWQAVLMSVIGIHSELPPFSLKHTLHLCVCVCVVLMIKHTKG